MTDELPPRIMESGVCESLQGDFEPERSDLEEENMESDENTDVTQVKQESRCELIQEEQESRRCQLIREEQEYQRSGQIQEEQESRRYDLIQEEQDSKACEKIQDEEEEERCDEQQDNTEDQDTDAVGPDEQRDNTEDQDTDAVGPDEQRDNTEDQDTDAVGPDEQQDNTEDQDTDAVSPDEQQDNTEDEDTDAVGPENVEEGVQYVVAAGVEDVVKQMQNRDINFDWEEDVNDPFEKAVVSRGKDKRPKSAEVNGRNSQGDARGQNNVHRNRGRVRRHGSFQSYDSLQESDSGSDIDFRNGHQQSEFSHRGNYHQHGSYKSCLSQESDDGSDTDCRNIWNQQHQNQRGKCYPRGSHQRCEPQIPSDTDSNMDYREINQERSHRNQRGMYYPRGSHQRHEPQIPSDTDSNMDCRDINQYTHKSQRGRYYPRGSHQHREPQIQSDTDNNMDYREINQERAHRNQRGTYYPRGSHQRREPQIQSDTDGNVDYKEINQERTHRNQRGGNYGSTRGRGRGRGNKRQYPPNEYNTHSSKGSAGVSNADQPYSLLETLIELPDYSSGLLNLFENNYMEPLVVRKVVESYRQIFRLNGEKVELRPEISICSAHSGPKGCLNRSSCGRLHICHLYITSWCSDSNCPLGHKWYTNHNKPVLRRFCLEQVPVQLLRRLMKSIMGSAGPVGQLDICRAYNSTGCSKISCNALHVCHSFVAGLMKCSLPNCQLDHNFLTPDNCKLLRIHGISPNEAPRDVAVALLAACPSLAKSAPAKPVASAAATSTASAPKSASFSSQPNSTRDTNIQQQDKTRSGLFAFLKQKISVNMSNGQDSAGASATEKSQDSSKSSDRSSPSNNSNGSSVRKKERATTTPRKSTKNDRDSASNNTATGKKAEKRQTVWTHYLQGDTDINEICYYSVENLCNYESSGCKRIHSSQHFHWQISEQGSKWLNLRSFQVKCLEKAFCDPAQDEVTIPPLDPAKLSSSVKGLLTVMERHSWRANFQSMVIVNSDQSKIMYLRRLCTEYIAGQQVKASIYCWFFSDINKKWVKYGNLDTAGNTKLVSSVTSSDIEKHFRQSEYKPLQFKNQSYMYVLDFVSMTQTNQTTNAQRQVRRRPEPHMDDQQVQVTGHNSSSGSTTTVLQVGILGPASDLPSTWEPMQPEERSRLVPLVPNSAEYNSVVSLLRNAIPVVNITKIERIQNPFSWRALQNKIKEMATVYGDIRKVDVRQLFHGTKAEVVPNICAENFDWRLHGQSTGQAHGQGVYFSPQAATSYGYCRSDASGLKYMFVARVAVGSITRGNPSMARPPINPATRIPYDSSGDGVSVVVKYDKQEYCPEYILTVR